MAEVTDHTRGIRKGDDRERGTHQGNLLIVVLMYLAMKYLANNHNEPFKILLVHRPVLWFKVSEKVLCIRIVKEQSRNTGGADHHCFLNTMGINISQVCTELESNQIL